MSELSQGTVHKVSTDLEAALRADPAVLALWESLTPLGRNEFICWVEDAKQAKTRERRIGRTTDELREGKGRPCCWPGCIHRTDKAPSAWQQAVLIDAKRNRGIGGARARSLTIEKVKQESNMRRNGWLSGKFLVVATILPCHDFVY